MLMLEALPLELLLRVLAYLPLQYLRSLRLTSRAWNAFFLANESSIYHQAALLHNFTDSMRTLPEAKEAHPLDFLQDVTDWYHYCRKYFQLQMNWFGRGTASVKLYGDNPCDVFRIKVDEQHGLLITTHEFGGLTVFDLETTEVLWKLSMTYVRRFAHCEYENGFLIFDRSGPYQEIWRLESVYDEAEEPTICRPVELQMQAWKTAAHRYASPGNRGHFRPWAYIQSPDFVRAYRFVYPNLVVCGLRAAFVWDVRTAEIVLQIDNVQGSAGAGDINYVEMSGIHVFVCSTSALRIFSRRDGSLIYEIPSYQLVYSDVRLAVQLDTARARYHLAEPDEAIALPAEPTLSTALYTASYAEFSAVHVSRDGRDLAAQLSDSRLIVIRDFQRVIRGEVSLKAATLESGKTIPRHGGDDEHFSQYLAYEHGRLGLATTTGIYTATLDPTYHGLIDEDLVSSGKRRVHGVPQSSIDKGLSFPYLTFTSLPFYHDRRQLAKVTCAQITETKLFFVWDAMYSPESIDFFRRIGMIGSQSPTLEPTAPLTVVNDDVDIGVGVGGVGQDEDSDSDEDMGGHHHEDDDDDEFNLFTTADTVAADAAAAAVAQAAAQAQPDSPMEEDFWEPAETQALLPVDTPGAGSSNALTQGNVAVEDDFSSDGSSEEEWEDANAGPDSDAESDGGAAAAPQAGARRPSPPPANAEQSYKTGPIVFCVDFSPR